VNVPLDGVDPPHRILVVDDERPNRELLDVMLCAEGFAVTTVSSGEEALASVAAEPPDLILLDVMMPGMNGYEVTTRLKHARATSCIPVIMVTALDDRAARLHGLQAGAEDFLSKPVDRAELTVRVRNLVRLKKYGEYHDRYAQMLETEVAARTAALVESERLYRSTFDAAPVGIVNMALDGRWLRVNQRLADLLGYSCEELQSRDVVALVRAPWTADEAEGVRALVAGEIARLEIPEWRYVRRDGSCLWAKTTKSVHRGPDGRAEHLIAVIEDITAQRTLETQLRQANKLDAIGSLAAGVAHDFNNLLSIVLSYSEMLAADLNDGDPMRADLDEINGAGHRAVSLTRQLLAFSRQQVLQPKVVDLAEVVDGMNNMLKRLLGEDVELTVVRASTSWKVLVDPGQMEQVIMNLAVNARDAMPRGGKLCIETSAVVLDAAYASMNVGMKPGVHVRLAVSDTGVGIDTATQARMFEPFFTTKHAGKGTGLGLSTVFGIVKQSGGTISVQSEPGKGTTFAVQFPATERAAMTSTSMAAPSRRTLRGSETILLVEDDPHFRAVARTILRKYGYDVLEAESGGDAFLLCEQYASPIHLLLTDVVMPRMSGRQLAERLRAVRPEMRVLYMSGYTDDAVLRHGIVGSTIAFMQKPITPEMLGRKVRETLGEVMNG